MIKSLFAIVLCALGIVFVILDGAAGRAHGAAVYSTSLFNSDKGDPLPLIVGGVPMNLPAPPPIPEGNGPVVISKGHGGDLRVFRTWVEVLRLSGRRVIVDGQIDSATALVMTLPNACATSRAVFRVHQVTNVRTGGIDLERTAEMLETYPMKAREIIARRGGLGVGLITIRARDILPPC
jgi:hypothetical protein